MVVRQLIALSSQLQLLDRLQHHIYLSSSLIFVSGEQGTGKSTLLELLANRVPGNVQEAFIQLNEQLTEEQIRQQIIVQLYEKPLFDASDSLFSSISLLQEKYPADTPRLIIFDNAHCLSEQLLAELQELIARKELLGGCEINVLLLADEEHNRQMLSSAKQNKYSVSPCLEFKLEALTIEESDSLFKHILRQADYQPQIQHQDALAKKLKGCAGIPQKIIKLAEQITAGELQSEAPSWLKTRLPAVLLMFALLAVAAGLANYLYPMFFKASSVKKQDVVENSRPQPPSNEAIPEQKEPSMAEELAGSWGDKSLPYIKENQLSVGVSDADVKRVVISETQISSLTTSAENKEDQTRKIPQPEEVTKTEEKQNVTEVAVEQEIQPVVKVLEKQQIRPLVQAAKPQVQQPAEVNIKREIAKPEEVIVQPVVLPAEIPFAEIVEAQSSSHSGAENSLAEEQEAEALPTVLPVKSAQQPTAADSVFTQTSKLLTVPAAHYTLQLSALASEKSLQQFILEYGLPQENLYLYQTIRNSKPWYVVIFGEYQSRQAADNARKNLPGRLAEMDSWIKKYQLVHQDLQLNNE